MVADALFRDGWKSAEAGVDFHFAEGRRDGRHIRRRHALQPALMRKREQHDAFGPLLLQRAVCRRGHGSRINRAGMRHDETKAIREQERRAPPRPLEQIVQQTAQLGGALRIPGAAERRNVYGAHGRPQTPGMA